MEDLFRKYPFDKIEQAYLDITGRMKVQKIENPKAYFLTLLADAEFGVKERELRQKKAQLQLDMLDSDKSDQEIMAREKVVKEKITQWIADNPTEYESLVEEEKMRL